MSKIHLSPPNQITGAGNKVYTSSAYEEKHLVRTGRGVFNGIYAVNKKASTKVYIWIFDNTSASGTPVVPPIPVSGDDGSASLDVMYGVPFTTGLYFASSSTVASYTATTTADLMVTIGYAVDSSTPTSDA